MITRIVAIAAVAAAGWLLWHVLSLLSSDAVGLALGLLFGMFATVPATLLVLAARERQERDGGYTVRHEHTHHVQIADAERRAYERGVADGEKVALVQLREGFGELSRTAQSGRQRGHVVVLDDWKSGNG